jgi:GH15 family glucan-1,4-alpha-glucosidase
MGITSGADAWSLQRHIVEFVEKNWVQPDEGIWEIRGPRRHFTHSKVMAWVAVDRAVKAVEQFGLEGPVERWRATREQMHAEICAKGIYPERGYFTQFYGSDKLDASLLMIPLVGFLPATDERVVRTVEAIKRDLTHDGFVFRYNPDESAAVDGLPPGEGVFLPCSFWLVDCLWLMGRRDEARAFFERLMSLRSPLGLLAEEYDPVAKRLVGNYPQAFTHVGLINTVQNLCESVSGPAEIRAVS